MNNIISIILTFVCLPITFIASVFSLVILVSFVSFTIKVNKAKKKQKKEFEDSIRADLVKINEILESKKK